jgi:hypothetical protein
MLPLSLLLTVRHPRLLCQAQTAHPVQIGSHEAYESRESYESYESYDSRESHERHMATGMKKLIIISCAKVLIDGNASNTHLSRVFVDKNYSVDQDDIITFMWERGAL